MSAHGTHSAYQRCERRCEPCRAAHADYVQGRRAGTINPTIGVVLDDVPAPGEWVRRAGCRGADAEIFFPERGERVAEAKAVCAACPVVTECRDYALPLRDLLGIWGGTSARERRALRRAGRGVA